MMNRAIFCIGSNICEAQSLIAKAVDALSYNGCSILASSDVYESSSPYLNQVLAVECDINYDSLNQLAKNIERSLGRSPEMKEAGIVPVDIDIVMFNGRIRRRADYYQPYFIDGYNQLRNFKKRSAVCHKIAQQAEIR